MAQIINLRANEYQTIVLELAKMHENQLKNVETVIHEIKTLITGEDGFSAEQTSNSLVDILDVISNDIMALLKQAFHDSEEGVANMIEAIISTDSVCG